MDGTKNKVDPREEVKKLQDLVRKLEIQNEQLRSRQHKQKDSSPSRNISGTRKRNSLGRKDNNSIANISLDEVEIIDVDHLDLSDEDSWLYISPKKLTDDQKLLSPYKWMRHDVEDPNNAELQSAKQALVRRLDGINRVSFSYRNSLLESPTEVVQGAEMITPVVKPSLGFKQIIDTRTFTRPKKKKEEQEISPVEVQPAVLESSEPQQSSPDVVTPEDDRLSVASDSSFSTTNLHKLSDVVDVQALARLQEESLRQSSPILSPRRTPVGKKHRFSQSNPDSLDDDSRQSSPSESPYGSQCLVQDQVKSESFRHSLPNLNKPFNGLLQNRNLSSQTLFKQHYNELKVQQQQQQQQQQPQQPVSGMYSHQYGDSYSSDKESTPNRDSLIPAPSLVRRESLPVSPCSSAPVRPASPSARSGIPLARRSRSPADAMSRSGLPKPTGRRFATPRMRTNLPHAIHSAAPRSVTSDESWKEGCY